MNLKINDESLLATLVSETYQCVDEKEENSSNLSAYFESRMSSEVEGSNSDHFLEDKLLRSNVSFSCMSYFLETSSFHFDLKGESYTCPRNWGEFERVFSEMNDTEYKIFEYFNEDYLLNEIFKSSIDYEYETIAFCRNGESYIIFMPKENVEILNWLKKYCESSEKAA